MKDNLELRFEALKFLKEWSTWLVGVETALLGFLVSLLLKEEIILCSVLIKGAALAFGISIIFAAWVLGAIPSIIQRLNNENQSIYEIGIFNIFLIKHIRLGWFTFFQHFFFLIGIIGLILAILNK